MKEKLKVEFFSWRERAVKKAGAPREMALVVSARPGGDVAMEDADPTMCLARLIQVMLHACDKRCSISTGGGRRGAVSWGKRQGMDVREGREGNRGFSWV